MFDMSMESLLLPFESWWANVAYYWCAAIVINMGWANVRASRWSCDGKVALITGGSEGTGLAMAKRFVKGGASVSILARNVSKLESAKKELMELVTKDTQSVVTIPCDVADYSAVEKAVNTSLSQHGVKAHDFVVTSAGLAIPGYLAEQDIEVFRKIMEVNYFGTLNVIKVCIPHMIETNNEGSIIFVSSAATYCGMIGYTQYCPSKYAVRGLSDALRNEMVSFNNPLVCDPESSSSKNLPPSAAAASVDANGDCNEGEHRVFTGSQFKQCLRSLRIDDYSIFC
eukprot:Nk52_evm44s2496 gene=Nk52_evmTU44s2496